MVEEKRVVAEEQGGFRRGKGCRDQVITLMLLGQMKARFSKGMFATLLTCERHMTGWIGKAMCLQDSGLGGRILSFLQVSTDP